MKLDTYNVLVDFHCSLLDIDGLDEQFAEAVHIEAIGSNQYQVGYGVHAPNMGEAYRRAVNCVEAKLALANVTSPSILGAHVYGPDDEEAVFD